MTRLCCWRQSEAIRRLSPRGSDLATRLGTAFERRIVEGGLTGVASSQPNTIDSVLGAARRRAEGGTRP